MNQNCAQCNFVFPNIDCFNFHLSSICRQRYICQQCKTIVYSRACGPQGHQCPRNRDAVLASNLGAIEICSKCKGPHKSEQPCYIQPLTLKEAYACILSRRRRNVQRIEIDNDENEETDPDPDFDTNNAFRSCSSRGSSQNEVDSQQQKRPLRFFIFDAECSQNLPLIDDNNRVRSKHIPLLIVGEIICENCITAGVQPTVLRQQQQQQQQQQRLHVDECVCGNLNRQRWDGARRWVLPDTDGRMMAFHVFDDPNVNPVAEMLNFLLNHGPRGIDTICLAHNGGRYDFHLILQEIHQNPQWGTPRLIMSGLKIYGIELRGNNSRRVIFKDTLNFFMCKLGVLPRAFALEGVDEKPYFPYKFIKLENLNRPLINEIPPAEDYQPDWMMESDRQKFFVWHNAESQRAKCEPAGTITFDLKKKLMEYCINDVSILTSAILRFREILMQTTNLDPFCVGYTAAGLALKIFRYRHLNPNTMVHSPEGGFLRGRRASIAALRWLRLYELEHPGVQVQTAMWSIGEATAEDSSYRLDGLVQRAPPARPLALEYMGWYVIIFWLVHMQKILKNCKNVLFINFWHNFSLKI